MAPFDRLEAFTKSYELGLAILRSTETWPKREMYGLSAQIRRSGTSISINIAEGSAKRGPGEFRRYLDIALGSLAETEVLLRFARDMKYAPEEAIQKLEMARTEASKLTWGLYHATISGKGR